MADGRPDHERIAIRFTVHSDAAELERNQTQQHPSRMKSPSLRDRFGESESSTDDQITKAIVDALSSDDKIVEIRPAKRSSGMGLKRLLLLGAVSIGFAYWVQNSQKPDDLIKGVKEKAANRTNQAAETIEAGSENASKRIEEGTDQASEAVQKAGEKVADRTEDAGEKTSDETDNAKKSSTT